jgi:hypothetical protein
VIGGPIGGSGTLVAAKTQFTIANTRDFFDGSAFGDTNKRWFPGLRNAEGTYNGLLDLSGDLLFEAAALGAQLLYLYTDTGLGASTIGVHEIAHGSGFLDGTVDTNLNGMVSVSGNFRASSNWTMA